MQLQRSSELSCSRGRPLSGTEPQSVNPLVQLGHILALPLVALGAGAFRMWTGPTPAVSGAVSSSEARTLRQRLRRKLRALRSTGEPFDLADVLPFSWTRLGVFAPTEDIFLHFPNADHRVASRLHSCDCHVVVIERSTVGLVYLTFGPSDEVPSAEGACLTADRIIVSRIHRDFVDYLEFAVAPQAVAT
jgi:hypothetical protein